MVEEEQTDPLEITKNPEVVKTAQNELSKVDVLVCGECHEVFHFIEQFQEHKSSDKCTKESVLKDGAPVNSKSQLWGFMLWKNSKFKSSSTDDNNSQPSSWNVYQLWCNLDQTQKDSWIAAGKSLQALYAITAGSTPGNKQGKIKLLNKKSNDEDDLDESENPLLENDPLADTESDLDLEEELTKHKLLKDAKCENGGIKKTILKPVELNSDVTILPSTKMKGPKKAIRTHEGKKRGEYAVEKIVSKRYNPGKKTHEYLIKWENFPDDQNTWEPVIHLESCKQLVDEFDRHLARLKAQKISRGSLVQRRPHKKTLPEKNPDLILTSTGPGRPQRTSKQKALNQVKVWCGNISDADESGTGKRAFSDSDSDSFEKKMKLEEESSDSDDDVRPPITVRKVVKTALNGISRKQPLPENILVPDAHGVVTINQKQLPALSSGVYVMSKTAGIIKLDSNTSKIAASGGHAVIKVAPKIGQTSIKVVKRGDPTSNGSKAPTILNSKLKPIMKPIGAKVIAHRRPPTTAAIIKKTEQPPKIETITSVEDDDSDGLEELPFPTDLPLPEPDSPPGEFTLCPSTGKILGQEYPTEEDETKGTIAIKQEAGDASATASNQTTSNDLDGSLDVLNELNCNMLGGSAGTTATDPDASVKMEIGEQPSRSIEAASGPDGQRTKEDAAGQQRTDASVAATIKQEEIDKTQSIEAALSAMEGRDEDDTSASAAASAAGAMSASSSSTSSILTTALSNANIEPSTPSPTPQTSITTTMTTTLPAGVTLLKKSEVPEAIRQKTAMNRHIINRTIVPKPAPQAIITRITPGSVNRSKQQQQMLNSRQKIVGGPPPTTIRKTIRQTYSNKNSPNMIRKIGGTAVATLATTPVAVVSRETTATLSTSTSISTESLVETLTSPGPSEVINMPLLTDLEAPSTSATELATETTAAETASATAAPQSTTLQSSTSETSLPAILNESDTPLLITGEDGTIYQVAGQNEDGQTILIAQDADGQQQCLLVASESTSELSEQSVVNASSPAIVQQTQVVASESTSELSEQSVVNASSPAIVQQTQQEQQQLEEPMVMDTIESENDNAEDSQIEQQLEEPMVMDTIESENDNAEDSQIVAQIVSAQPPSPGGTRKVVLMLPDGNLMMTEVTAEQYAALELDK
ncbi:Chromo (CHRromatin Organization MOdifier) domain [Popillia japonica]|uniref:Chromo (CHRromatin Organization MOdifier) domain n=1 Tax=Popillia japonica TaxID=7064 RepID=A0AAW1IW22_POPJA